MHVYCSNIPHKHLQRLCPWSRSMSPPVPLDGARVMPTDVFAPLLRGVIKELIELFLQKRVLELHNDYYYTDIKGTPFR